MNVKSKGKNKVQVKPSRERNSKYIDKSCKMRDGDE